MCLILVAHRACARYPLVIAANRDEAYARPALPADRWADAPQVYGGRDALAGGAWLALSLAGRYAAVTNFRQGGTRNASLKSRGELVGRFVQGSASPHDYAEAVHAQGSGYNGFSLLVGDFSELYFASNRGNGLVRVTPGVHGLSNHLLDEPWPKVVKGIELLSSSLHLAPAALADALYAFLADRTPAPDAMLPSTGIARERERELSAAFVASARYGTRASTVIVVDANGKVRYSEKGYGPNGAPLYGNDAALQLAQTPACDARLTDRA
jgi:uncharacterized protein with NRDE domain